MMFLKILERIYRYIRIIILSNIRIIRFLDNFLVLNVIFDEEVFENIGKVILQDYQDFLDNFLVLNMIFDDDVSESIGKDLQIYKDYYII